MSLAQIPLDAIEPGQLNVMRVRAAIQAAILLAIAGAAEFFWFDDLPFTGLVAGPVALLAVWMVALSPQPRWRRWGYAFTGSELHVAHGWLTQLHTIVPVSRVQHIDVGQGPLERTFGVATLTLHTAGTANSVVVLPGITRETAEAIRDAIRQRIGSTAA